MEPETFIEIWNLTQEKSGAELAEAMLDVYSRHDSDLKPLIGYDNQLDEAINTRMEEDGEHDGNDEDEN